MPTLTIDWERSPRIIIVDAPDTEISAQQLVDLLRDAEDEPDNTAYDKLIEASGKEPLGGGTTVGITAELQNAKVGFKDRTNKLESGTVTTPDVSGKTLTDSTALFQTNNVEIGDLVVNITDGSHATIIEVTSETSVLTTGLNGGTDNQFASADSYEVWEIIPCEITGGNVVAVDDVGAELDPLLPSFGVYAKVSKASTGTLTEQGDIQQASFGGAIHVDVVGGISGSAYPAGNEANPVNNLVDAATISTARGIDVFDIKESLTLSNEAAWSKKTFVGRSKTNTRITVSTLANVADATFRNCSIDGVLGEETTIDNCLLGNVATLSGLRGIIENCSFGSFEITVGGTSSDVVRINNCRGAGEAFAKPTLNLNGDGPEVDISNYSGTLSIKNKTGAAVVSVDIEGSLTVEPTVTSDTLLVDGRGQLSDNSGPLVTVVDDMTHGQRLSELWTLQGLDTENPITITKSPGTRISQAGDVELDISGDDSQVVVTRIDTVPTLDAPLLTDLVDSKGATASFTRASSGYYFDSGAGIFSSQPTNTPRFEQNGLLIEGPSTNSALGSNLFSDETYWTWNLSLPQYEPTLTSVTPAISGVTAWKHGGPNLGLAERNQNIGTFVNAQEDTAYVLMENVDAVDTQIAIYDETDLNYVHRAKLTWATLDLSTTAGSGGLFLDDYGTGPNGGRMVGIGITGVGTASGAGGNGNTRAMYIYYTGIDPNSLSAIIHHAQFEADQGFPTSPIVTVASPVARSADFLSYNSDLSIKDDAGSVIANITPLYGSSTANDGVIVNCANQLIGPLYITDDTTTKSAIGDGTLVGSHDPVFVRGETTACASRWETTTNKMQSVAGGLAGTEVAYDGAFTRFAGTLYVGSTSTANHLYGNINSLKIYEGDRTVGRLLIETG